MNILGQSVAKTLRHTVVDSRRMLVIQDDVKRAPGDLKFTESTAPEGHRGIRGINHALCKSIPEEKYYRLKVGIGSGIKSAIVRRSRALEPKTCIGTFSLLTTRECNVTHQCLACNAL
jgi:peptidyl-tRNA hydrolase